MQADGPAVEGVNVGSVQIYHKLRIVMGSGVKAKSVTNNLLIVSVMWC